MTSTTSTLAVRILRTVELFFKNHHVVGKPVLLGFSGGHDSRALFELLCKSLSRRKPGFELLVAHIDHGWREESKQEASDLKILVESRGLPFYLQTLPSPAQGVGNLEEWCREERYKFFQSLYQTHNCQALILGHQADDQAETILKRLFEGAHFTTLGAMSPVSLWEGMNVWRPLLEYGKEDILDLLQDMGIQALDDRTNYDPSFLRARMRTSLLPVLEQAFGKSFRGNLLEFAKSFQDLRAYFVEKSFPYWKEKKKTANEASLDFSGFTHLSPLEMEVAIKLFLQEEGVVVGTRHLKQLVGHLVANAAKKKLILQKHVIIIDRKKLFISLFK